MKNNTKAYIFTAMAILFWATSATAFKIALKYVSPFHLLLYSVFVSTISLFVIIIIQKKLNQLFRLKLKNILIFAGLGFLNPFLYYLILFEAYSLLPGQIAMSLNYAWPIALILLSVPILKQTLTSQQVLAVLISFIGAVIIATRGEIISFTNVSYLGVTLAIVSTLIWATFWLTNAKDKQDPVIKLFIGFCFGLVYTFLASPFWGGIEIPVFEAWVPLIYIGMFEMGVTFVLWLIALKLASSAARIGNLIFIAPFLSLVFLNLILGEEIYVSTFLGLVLIVAGIIIQTFASKDNL
ncbi:MAG: DMT family transporter [Calditrichaeota bacterium]|nr:MAG: DMT family transporter [Calditrichota bacterium]MBL1203820.1 DMT family transporter [Calditrichota bacterium]NOG43651.1 DMT family transporter [Calditrichota bacterium]